MSMFCGAALNSSYSVLASSARRWHSSNKSSAIALAKFSQARAAPQVAARTGLPVLTSVDSVQRCLRTRLSAARRSDACQSFIGWASSAARQRLTRSRFLRSAERFSRTAAACHGSHHTKASQHQRIGLGFRNRVGKVAGD